MQKDAIIAAIEEKVGGFSYSKVRIGITHNPDERKAYWKDTEKQKVYSWTQWLADSLEDAREIEAHFIHEKKMEGGTGGDMTPGEPTYVYIF
jgi:hypothetical protein